VVPYQVHAGPWRVQAYQACRETFLVEAPYQPETCLAET